MNEVESWAQAQGSSYVALASLRADAFYLALTYEDGVIPDFERRWGSDEPALCAGRADCESRRDLSSGSVSAEVGDGCVVVFMLSLWVAGVLRFFPMTWPLMCVRTGGKGSSTESLPRN
ncbi:hypothetical protein GCM10017710_34940 [Arthrobacter ramosus]